MTQFKSKIECSSYGNKFNQKWASLLIYNNNYCFEETARFGVKVLFARGPVSHLIKPGDISSTGLFMD